MAGAAELITDGEDGFKLNNPKDSGEISEKLKFLVESDSARKLMGRKARQTAEKHSWDDTAKGMLNTFEEAMRR